MISLINNCTLIKLASPVGLILLMYCLEVALIEKLI